MVILQLRNSSPHVYHAFKTSLGFHVNPSSVWLRAFVFTVYGYNPFTQDVPVILQCSLCIINTKVKHGPTGINSPETAAVTGCGSVWPGAAAAAAGS